MFNVYILLRQTIVVGSFFCISTFADVLLSDEMSTLNNWEITYQSSASAMWSSDGTNANFNSGSNNGRATLTNRSVFDFNPGGIAYHSVILEFTADVSNSSGSSANRF